MTRQRELILDNDLTNVTAGRHFVRQVLLDWGLAALVEDAELGASELVANAVRHAGTDLLLSVTAEAAEPAGEILEVVIAIQDGEPELRRPLRTEMLQLAESGRGLHIVAAISRDWGIRAVPGGKIVWFSLELPDSRHADADVYQLSRHRSERPAADPHRAGRSVEGARGAV